MSSLQGGVMKNSRFSRREFLTIGAAATGVSLAGKSILLDPEPLWAGQAPVTLSDQVRFGIIGVGMQGSDLLATSLRLPGVKCVSACDLYDGRRTVAREIAGSTLTTTRHYEELLADKNIDCLIVAVPDHWHKQIVADAVSAGKDIY